MIGTLIAYLPSEVRVSLEVFFVLGLFITVGLIGLLRKLIKDQVNEQFGKKIPKPLKRFVKVRIKFR